MTHQHRCVIRLPKADFRFSLWGAVALTLLASTVTTPAAGAPAAATSSRAAEFKAELVKPGLYRLKADGGSTLLRLGSSGAIVVDSSRTGLYGPLMAEVQAIAKGVPIGALVLTATGPAQIGTVAQFIDAGIPVIVQQRAQRRVAGLAGAYGSAAARPFITYGTDHPLHVGDVDAEVEHVGSGKTGVDSVVYFRDLRVVAVGGLYTSGTPEPDCESGGSYAGWAAAIAHVLWFDFDIAVPDRGAPVGKLELSALKSRLESLAEREVTPASVTSGCRPPR